MCSSINALSVLMSCHDSFMPFARSAWLCIASSAEAERSAVFSDAASMLGTAPDRSAFIMAIASRMPSVAPLTASERSFHSARSSSISPMISPARTAARPPTAAFAALTPIDAALAFTPMAFTSPPKSLTCFDAVLMPDPTAPAMVIILESTRSAGPIPATTAAVAITLHFSSSLSSLNSSAATPTVSATSLTTGASAWPICIPAVSIAPFISSIARSDSPICDSARRCAAVWSFVAAVYFSIPSRPLFVMTRAARLASDPKIVCIAASFSALESPPSLSVSSWATPAASSMLPLLSRTLIPSASIVSAALSVGAARRWSMVLSDVPASLPTMPASANAPRTAVVSWIDQPAE